jgi:hypothetical protein
LIAKSGHQKSRTPVAAVSTLCWHGAVPGRHPCEGCGGSHVPSTRANGDAWRLGMAPPDANPTITANSVVVATKDQVSSDLAGEAVVLSLRTAMYYGLDQVGLRIWELVREPMRVAAIRDTIAHEYEVELERCERDVLDLLRQLASEGLIEVRDATEAAR